jgi:sterol desaturase/sphingolipid hydroxylase (fatty acid hydroxylase superfamily)
MNMTIVIVLTGLFLIILERIFPDQKLPYVKGWWLRVIIINVIQLGILFLGAYTWDRWLKEYAVFHLSDHLPSIAGGFLSYFIITFVFYWWHRWRHTSNALWLLFHQVHHSPQRIETITSFYKHPLEIICDSILIGAVNFTLLGLDLQAAGWCIYFASLGEYIYHMNIKTPYWMGFIFQRPEMHRIHHQRGRHFSNFSDLPFWDMLFGTFKNPKKSDTVCGFRPEREERLLDMMLFKNVNDPYKPGKKP